MWRLVDTHCHLDFERFADDREAVLARAAEAGVWRMVTLGVEVASSRRAVSLAEQHAAVYAAVGVHPNEAAHAWEGEATLNTLRILAGHPKVVAIGEIGLDYYRDHTPPALQREVLRAQLTLAAELGLPVSLHNREATADLLDILTDWAAGLRAQRHPLADRPGVWHAFSGDAASAERAMALGFFLGIGGPITFKNATERRAVVAVLPLEHLVLETDAPFLAPHPYRGRRNEPAYVRFVAEKIAEIQGRPVAEVARQTTRNAQALFGWRDED